jgi:hypothetical protein
MDMRYRPAGLCDEVDWKAGESLDFSSAGLYFRASDTFSPGQEIEALVDWPARLDNGIALRLAVRGRIVRSADSRAAMRFDQYEFRSRSTAEPR